MYKSLAVLVVLLISFIGISTYGQTPCEDMNSRYIKELLGDADYDNFRRTEIKFSEDPYDIEFRVDLLKNYVYKLIFDMSGKSEGVVVKLYDLGGGPQSELKEPKLLYTSTEDKMNENATFDVSFKAPKTRMLVKYEVKDATYEGCVTFMLGVINRDADKLNANANANLTEPKKQPILE